MAGIGEIIEAIGIMSDCASVGGFTFEKIASKLNTLAAVGSLVKGIIDIFKPNEHKEIMNKLAELERKIDKVSQEMTDKFNELKAFMTEFHFYTDFAEVAVALLRHVQDTLKSPSKDSYSILFTASQRTPPLDSVYKLTARLGNGTTNPLKWAMNADKLMTKSTFDKWHKIVDGVLCQFLLLETYINGLFWHKNMIGPNLMKSAISEIMRTMDAWKQDYLRNDHFWPDRIARFVHDTQDHHQNVGNESKANILKDAFKEILTDSIFYVIVYNDCAGYDHHAYYGLTDHFVCSFRRGKCNTVIYRSRDARHANPSDVDRLRKDVESCTWWFIPKRISYKKYVENLYKSGKFHNIGMVGMIKASHGVVIRSTNDCGREPGAWTTAHIRHQPNFILIAGFK